MRRHTDTDDDELRTVHVPLFQMDSRRFDDVQRDVAATFGDLEQLRRLRDAAYEARELADTTAWQHGNAKYCPSCGYDLSAGDDLTRAGGSEQEDAARNPRNQHFDLDSAKAARAQAYADIENEQINAWKKGKP
jgi:hypothetical protein